MKKKQIFILTIGVFSILNTEMGVVGILPEIADAYGVPITSAGLLVSLFALVVAFAGPTMPLFMSRFNRKTVMAGVLGVFTGCNLLAAFAPNFPVLLIARVIPAFFHPVFISQALSAASASVEPAEAPKAVSRVMVGVSAGSVVGVPAATALSNLFSLRAGMLFFAAVSAAALVLTLLFIPSLPARERLSYGSQLRVLKKPGVWLAILGVICLNGGLFGVYSYLSDFLSAVTGFSAGWVSGLLLVYGLANIIGNTVAGQMLSKTPLRFAAACPALLIGLYILLLLFGGVSWAMAALVLLWGIIAGCVGNVNQYWIAAAAPEAPDFANGLFLASTNLGTTIGTSVCGAVIASFGMRWIELGGFALLAGSLLFILWQTRRMKR